MSTNTAAIDVQDLADAIVAREVANHVHPRAMARALARSAGNAIAAQESEEAAADVHFRRWSKHNARAAKAPRFAGSRRR